eukprot:1147666-Pelagomonas_calceolata.AAC.2
MCIEQADLLTSRSPPLMMSFPDGTSVLQSFLNNTHNNTVSFLPAILHEVLQKWLALQHIPHLTSSLPRTGSLSPPGGPQ